MSAKIDDTVLIDDSFMNDAIERIIKNNDEKELGEILDGFSEAQKIFKTILETKSINNDIVSKIVWWMDVWG